MKRSYWAAPFGDERYIDFYFVDAVIFVETMEVSSLDVLSKESGIVGLLGKDKYPKFHPDC